MSLENWVPSKRLLSVSGVVFIFLLAIVPLFFSFPYRVNIFLSWEGAYRMSHGQLPFRDFGTPLGGMYWVVPAVFFKIFGPQLITLIKAQVFLNIIAGLSFASVLKSCKVQPGIRFVSIFLFCISYSFFNFWPWYNHTVIVYELAALAFLFRSFNATRTKSFIRFTLLASLFTCFSFLTKQDGGGMTFMICMILAAYNSWADKSFRGILIYTGGFFVLFFLLIAPFLSQGFGYWFNHGQPPHTARFSISEIAGEFFSSSKWIKFYLILMLLPVLAGWKKNKDFFKQKEEMLFLLLTLGILGEAAVFQVTSYTPPDNNIFFHSFAFAYLLSGLARFITINFSKGKVIVVSLLAVLLWWSDVYWKYIERILERISPPPKELAVSPTGENVINRRTFTLNLDSSSVSESDWIYSDYPVFKRIYMPASTVEGIKRIMNLPQVNTKQGGLKVLNMSELTPLAAVFPYEPEKNPELPLWYHLGVGMFNKQARVFEKRISEHYYDLVLFEYIPSLNNFYPFRVRDSLEFHYRKIDSFAAPRRGETVGIIEVFVPE